MGNKEVFSFFNQKNPEKTKQMSISAEKILFWELVRQISEEYNKRFNNGKRENER